MTRPASYNLVWAEDAAADQMGGETSTADQGVIEQGWVGSATAEPPTARMQNYWQIRVDLGLQEIERQGCLSWRSDVNYQAGAFVFYASNLFQAVSSNIAITPQGSGDVGIWSLLLPGQWPTTVDNITGTLPISKGGTGATTAAGALTNLGAAPITSPTFLGSPRAPTQAPGDSSTLLATDGFVQAAVNGAVSLSIAGGTTTTLTQAQYGVAILILTGAVTANKAVVFPAQAGHWQVVNNTTGAFTITLKTASGTGVVVTSGTTTNIYCDGTNIGLQQTDFISPALTGTPTSPTAAAGTSSNQIATMLALLQGMAAFGIGTPNAPNIADLNTVSAGGFYYASSTASNQPITSNGSFVHIPFADGSAALQIFSTLSSPSRIFYRTKASNSWLAWKEFSMLDSPAFTGTPTAPTAASGTATTQLATTAFADAIRAALQTSIDLKAPLASPALTGTPTVPTAAAGTSTTQAASTAFVAAVQTLLQTAINLKAPLASPALTGTPTVPTATSGTSTTQAASTAFVQSAVSLATGRLIGIQILTATGVYTATSGTTRVRVTVIGGGAAGGTAGATTSGTVAGAGGGGAGGVAQSLLPIGSLSGTTATIGSAGAPSSSTAGGAGGATTFAGLTANGGTGGALVGPLAPPQGGLGGSGGTASGGNVFNMRGGNGMHGAASGTGYVLSGSGGSNPFGGGGPGNLLSTATSVAGTVGLGYGAGGGGGASNSGAVLAAGANGTTGAVIIEEYT
ncbi:hypothetical protein RAM80_07405 [Pseudomonas sp. App30]|uniref:hypothetical protein n=1 Tax=Pseudomonas sp. App30 TaxID=3068990 RepID=UPI003A7FD45D